MWRDSCWHIVHRCTITHATQQEKIWVIHVIPTGNSLDLDKTIAWTWVSKRQDPKHPHAHCAITKQVPVSWYGRRQLSKLSEWDTHILTSSSIRHEPEQNQGCSMCVKWPSRDIISLRTQGQRFAPPQKTKIALLIKSLKRCISKSSWTKHVRILKVSELLDKLPQ